MSDQHKGWNNMVASGLLGGLMVGLGVYYLLKKDPIGGSIILVLGLVNVLTAVRLNKKVI